MSHTKRQLSWIAFAGCLLVSGCGSGTNAMATFPHLKCMVNVLKHMPRVSNIKTGSVESKGEELPTIQYYYNAPGPAWRSGTIYFTGQVGQDAQKKGGTVIYMAAVSGLATPGTKPADYGTKIIGPMWYKKCKVDALLEYM